VRSEHGRGRVSRCKSLAQPHAAAYVCVSHARHCREGSKHGIRARSCDIGSAAGWMVRRCLSLVCPAHGRCAVTVSACGARGRHVRWFPHAASLPCRLRLVSAAVLYFSAAILGFATIAAGGVMVCPALTVAPDGTVARQLSCHSTVIATVPSERAA